MVYLPWWVGSMVGIPASHLPPPVSLLAILPSLAASLHRFELKVDKCAGEPSEPLLSVLSRK